MLSLRKFPAVALTAACAAALAAGALLARENKKAQAAALLAKARQLSNIRAPGSPPFRMEADITVLDWKGHPVAGSYSLDWASPGHWHDQVHLGKYERVRVRSGGKLWVKATDSSHAARMFLLDQLLDPAAHLELRPGESVGPTQPEKVGAYAMACAQVKRNEITDRILCFDPQDGALLRIADSGLAYEYVHYFSKDARAYPRLLTLVSGKGYLMQVRIRSLQPEPHPSPALLRPPAGATPSRTCDHPTPPHVTKRPFPSYPPLERMRHIQGAVILYAVIGADGRVHNVQVIQPLDSELDHSALDAVSKWQYSPATCGGSPVSTRTLIKVNYTLQP